LLSGKCNVEPYLSSQALKPHFTRSHRGWLNFHWQVFRPVSERVDLQISDWLSADDSGRYDDQQLMCNFVEVQPYLED